MGMLANELAGRVFAPPSARSRAMAFEKLTTVSSGPDAQVLQVLRTQAWQDRVVYVVVSECGVRSGCGAGGRV